MRLNSDTCMSANKIAKMFMIERGYSRKYSFRISKWARHWSKHCRFPDGIKPFS